MVSAQLNLGAVLHMMASVNLLVIDVAVCYMLRHLVPNLLVLVNRFCSLMSYSVNNKREESRQNSYYFEVAQFRKLYTDKFQSVLMRSN